MKINKQSEKDSKNIKINFQVHQVKTTKIKRAGKI